MWNGAAEALKAMPARIIANPATNIGSPAASPSRIAFKPTPGPPGGLRVADRVEAQLARRPVRKRGAEEEDRRAEAADDQVLEPGLQRRVPVRVEGAEDVEDDREPLEAEEEGHQVPGLDEEEHPGAGGREQRVVLAHVGAPATVPGDEDGERAGPRQGAPRERGESVARQRLRDQLLGVGRAVEDEGREHA